MQYQAPSIPQQGVLYSHSSYQADPTKTKQISVGQPATTGFVQNVALKHSTKSNQPLLSSQKTTPIKFVQGQQTQQPQAQIRQPIVQTMQSPRNHSQSIMHQNTPSQRNSIQKSNIRMSKTPGKYGPGTTGNIIQQGGILASVKQVGTPSTKVDLVYSKPQQQQQISGFQKTGKISSSKDLPNSISPKKGVQYPQNNQRQRVISVAPNQKPVQGTQQAPIHSNFQPVQQQNLSYNTVNLKRSGGEVIQNISNLKNSGRELKTSGQQQYIEKKKHRRIISQSNLGETTDRDFHKTNTKPDATVQEPEFIKIAKNVDSGNFSGSNTSKNIDSQQQQQQQGKIDSKQQLFSFSSYNNSPQKVENKNEKNKIVSNQFSEQEKAQSAQQIQSYNHLNLNKVEYSVNKESETTVIKIGNLKKQSSNKSHKKTKSFDKDEDTNSQGAIEYQKRKKSNHNHPMERQKSYANFSGYGQDVVLDNEERESIRQSKQLLQEEYNKNNQNYSKIKLTNYVKPTISNDNGYKFAGNTNNFKENKSAKLESKKPTTTTTTTTNNIQHSTKIQNVTSHFRSGSSYRFQGEPASNSQRSSREQKKQQEQASNFKKQNAQLIGENSYQYQKKEQDEPIQYQRQAASLQNSNKNQLTEEHQKRSHKPNQYVKKDEVKQPSTPFINFNSYQPAGDFQNKEKTPVHVETPISKFDGSGEKKDPKVRAKNVTEQGPFELQGTLQQYSREVRSQEASPKSSNTQGSSPPSLQQQDKIAEYQPSLNKSKTLQDEVHHKTPKNAFLKSQKTQPAVGSTKEPVQQQQQQKTGNNYNLGQMYNFTSYTYGQPTSYTMQNIVKNIKQSGGAGGEVQTPQNISSAKKEDDQLQSVKRSQTFTQQMLKFNNNSGNKNTSSPQQASPYQPNTPRYDNVTNFSESYKPAQNQNQYYKKNSNEQLSSDYHNKSTNSSGKKSKPSQFSYKAVSINNDNLVKDIKTLPTEEAAPPQEKVKKQVKTYNDFDEKKKPEPKVIYKIGHNYTTSIDQHLKSSSKKEKPSQIPISKIEKIDDKTKIVLKSSGKSSKQSDQDSEASSKEIMDIANKYAEYTPSAKINELAQQIQQQQGGYHTAKNPTSNLKSSKGTSFTTASNQANQHGYAPINLNNPTHLKQYQQQYVKTSSSPFTKVQMPNVHKNNFNNNIPQHMGGGYPLSNQVLDERSPLNRQDNGRNGWNLNKFWILKSLGKGIFGKAYLAIEKETNYVMALKVMDKKKIQQMNLVDQTTKEVKIHSFLNHPNIVSCYGCFDTNSQVILSLEFCDGGNLYELLYKQPNRKFTEPQAAHFMAQVIGSVSYLHSLGIIHRDIKPENILVCRGDTVKLSDFGIASINDGKRKTFCGTLEYVSPEIIGRQVYDINVDVWALGVLAYELCNGDPPFMGENQKTVITNVNFVMPQQFSRDLQDFVYRLLKKDPQQRMTLDEALRHQWIQKNVQLYEKNFSKDVNSQLLKQGHALVYN